MVKFDPSMLRFMSRDDFRVLNAIEIGMKRYTYVPVDYIIQLAKIRGSVRNSLSTLHKYDLIKRENMSFEGFKLTYNGYDYLALNTFVKKGLIKGIGHRIGVGKESDIYEAINDNDEQLILKIHRLGRICFRSVRTKREYTRSNGKLSFMYLSRLAAIREFAYMKALYDEGFPTPIPYEVNRHCILMSRADAQQMAGISSVKNPEKVYNNLMNLIVQFAQCGLVHGDFNEFNLLINENDDITVIDFPQMISTSHKDAKYQFERDVNCIRRFFSKKLGYDFDDYPRFIIDIEKEVDLDVALKAAGAHVSKNELRNLDTILEVQEEYRAYDEDDDDDDYDDEYDDMIEIGQSKQKLRQISSLDEDEEDDDFGVSTKFLANSDTEEEEDNGDDNDNDDDDEPTLMMLTEEHMANMNLLSDTDEDEDNESKPASSNRTRRRTRRHLTAAQVRINVKKKQNNPKARKFNQNKVKDRTKIQLRQEVKEYR